MPMKRTPSGLFFMEDEKPAEPKQYDPMNSLFGTGDPDKPRISVEECEHIDFGHVSRPGARLVFQSMRGKKYVYRCGWCGTELVFKNAQETYT